MTSFDLYQITPNYKFSGLIGFSHLLVLLSQISEGVLTHDSPIVKSSFPCTSPKVEYIDNK